MPVVPLRVQRLLKRRAPRAAYVPTRLPSGYSYISYQNFNRYGFDIYFTCCDDKLPLIGFDALLVKKSDPCNQGSPQRMFRIDRVVVQWNGGVEPTSSWRGGVSGTVAHAS